MDQDINEILSTFEFYIELIESPEVFSLMDINYVKRIFEACLFIEKTIKKVEEENKELIFESHLNNWMSKTNRTMKYECSNFKYACDKMLEFCLKDDKLSIEVIDELLKLYVQECGSERLEIVVRHMLNNSMQGNAILQIINNFKIPQSEVEDEIIIASWEHEIRIGKRQTIVEFLIDMFNEEHIPRLINLAYKSKTNSPVNKLLLDFFADKLVDNHISLYTELKDTDKKILFKLLMDNTNFQTCFVDATFYIGRSMKQDNEADWISDTGLSYDDLKNMINLFLDGPEDFCKSIIGRIKLAKELDDIWETVERDCILNIEQDCILEK